MSPINSFVTWSPYFFGANLSHQPFPGINPQPGAIDVLMVNRFICRTVAAFLLDKIILAVVSDFDNFFSPMLRLQFPRARVLITKFQIEPPAIS